MESGFEFRRTGGYLHEGNTGRIAICALLIMGVINSNFVEYIDGIRWKREVNTLSIAADRKMR